MEYNEWSDLKTKLAIEVMARDMCDNMIPYQDGLDKAEEALSQRQAQALDVEWRMGQALIALETLGYQVTPTQTPEQEIMFHE